MQSFYRFGIKEKRKEKEKKSSQSLCAIHLDWSMEFSRTTLLRHFFSVEGCHDLNLFIICKLRVQQPGTELACRGNAWWGPLQQNITLKPIFKRDSSYDHSINGVFKRVRKEPAILSGGLAFHSPVPFSSFSPHDILLPIPLLHSQILRKYCLWAFSSYHKRICLKKGCSLEQHLRWSSRGRSLCSFSRV